MDSRMRIQGERPVAVVLVGVSGMGFHYLRTLIEEFSPQEVRLLAAVDPFPQRSELYPELKRRGIPLFSSLESFYERGERADLVIISSPIHFHVPQSCVSLRHGSRVLCEKPLGATVQEAERLIRTRDESGGWVMIGYQWSFSTAIQALKGAVLSGELGRARRLKTLCVWPRGEDYYAKSDWLGRKKDGAGNWILDSPANNAMAHFLHNLFYVLGDKAEASAAPVEVKAESYRAYPIENFDTVACRAFTSNGAELLFYACHTVQNAFGPMFSFEFEKARVTYGEAAAEIVILDQLTGVKHLGSPEAEHPFRKLFTAVAAVRQPGPILCGPEAARSQTLCVNGIQESVPESVNFPQHMIYRDKVEKGLWVKGLDQALMHCYERGLLPGEAGFSWAQPGQTVNLRNYRFFPGGVPDRKEEAGRP